MDLFAYRMGYLLDRPMIDRTGLTGSYDFTLTYTMEPPDSMRPGMSGHDGRPIDFSGPTIFAALPKQMGLRLESAKAPVETMLIEAGGKSLRRTEATRKVTKVFVDNDDNLRHYVCMVAKPLKPTEAELLILQVLWDGGPRSVRDILHILQASKPTGYTTALKMLQIMSEKGLVDRDDSVRPQIYRARYSRENTQKRMLTDLLDRAFGGSVKALVLQALSSKKSTPEELADIERLLDRLDENSKGNKK